MKRIISGKMIDLWKINTMKKKPITETPIRSLLKQIEDKARNAQSFDAYTAYKECIALLKDTLSKL